MEVKQQRFSGHLFRLMPSQDQADLMAQFCGMTRYVFNRALAIQKKQYSTIGRMDRLKQLQKLLPVWKTEDQSLWLSGAPAQALQGSLRNLENAWQRFFDPKLPGAERPTFRKRSKHCACQFPQGFELDQHRNRVKLPKLGWISYIKSKELIGEVRSVTVRRKNGHWDMSVLCRTEVATPAVRRHKWMGVDLGIANQAACSNGAFLHSPKRLRHLANIKVRLQAFRDRNMTKGSKRFARTCLRINRLDETIANIRRDHIHKATTLLVKSQDVVVLEDLKVKQMSKSAKGDMENPGSNVAAKRGLNRQILAQGWGEIRRQLEYKMAWTGGMVVAVDRRYTSQRCHACDVIDKASRTSQSRFVCTACGEECHADINAAKNILAAGLVATERGALGIGRAVKRSNSEQPKAA